MTVREPEPDIHTHTHTCTRRYGRARTITFTCHGHHACAHLCTFFEIGHKSQTKTRMRVRAYAVVCEYVSCLFIMHWKSITCVCVVAVRREWSLMRFACSHTLKLTGRTYQKCIDSGVHSCVCLCVCAPTCVHVILKWNAFLMIWIHVHLTTTCVPLPKTPQRHYHNHHIS